MEDLLNTITAACRELFDVEVTPELTRVDEKFGDFATNVALQLANKLSKNPREVAEELVGKISSGAILKTEVAGPGFINIFLTDQALLAILKEELPHPNTGREILVEFGDPNPFKEMHIGHLYSSVVGDAISGLLETSGATVRRLSYHGDVGLHIAKAIFGMRALQKERGYDGNPLSSIPKNERYEFIQLAYAGGSAEYEKDPGAKEQIDLINQRIYAKDDPEINELYETGKQWSFDYFDEVYRELGIKYDDNGRYLESAAMDFGINFVRDNVGKVFEESEGAIVYKGEKVGLHTRVFITSKGLPTYETKDLGLVELKNKDYPNANRSIIITASEQSEYFKVMLAALAEIDSDLAKKTTHLSHGFLSLTTGKMSSRTGNVYAAADLLESVKTTVEELYPDSEIKHEVYIGAVKYAFLKHRLGQDIVVNPKEAASLEGNSGPYLQYAHARASSILRKKEVQSGMPESLEAGERSLVLKISEFREIVDKAVQELLPHHICTYLYELAQVFNRFYEHNRVIDDPRETARLQLVNAYAETLKNGLSLLNISAPDRM